MLLGLAPDKEYVVTWPLAETGVVDDGPSVADVFARRAEFAGLVQILGGKAERGQPRAPFHRSAEARHERAIDTVLPAHHPSA